VNPDATLKVVGSMCVRPGDFSCSVEAGALYADYLRASDGSATLTGISSRMIMILVSGCLVQETCTLRLMVLI